MAVVVFEHGPSTGALRLAATLRDYGHRLRVIALHEGDQVPQALDDVDGVVTSGGRQSALDDHPWMYAKALGTVAAVGVAAACGSRSLAGLPGLADTSAGGGGDGGSTGARTTRPARMARRIGMRVSRPPYP